MGQGARCSHIFHVTNYVTKTAHHILVCVTQPFDIGPVPVGRGNLFLIAGPCVLESEAHARTLADAIQRIAADLGDPIHLQGQLRQGQPHQHPQLPRPRPSRRRTYPALHRPINRLARSHRRPHTRRLLSHLRRARRQLKLSCRFRPSSAARPISSSPPRRPAAPSISRRASSSLPGTCSTQCKR